MVPGCSGVRSCRLACNFSPNPGHGLCGFIRQSLNIPPLPGGSLHSLGLVEFSSRSVFRAGRGCLSLPGVRQAPLRILLLLFPLTNCHGPSGSIVPSALRGDGPHAWPSSLPPSGLCPSLHALPPTPTSFLLSSCFPFVPRSRLPLSWALPF